MDGLISMGGPVRLSSRFGSSTCASVPETPAGRQISRPQTAASTQRRLASASTQGSAKAASVTSSQLSHLDHRVTNLMERLLADGFTERQRAQGKKMSLHQAFRGDHAALTASTCSTPMQETTRRRPQSGRAGRTNSDVSRRDCSAFSGSRHGSTVRQKRPQSARAGSTCSDLDSEPLYLDLPERPEKKEGGTSPQSRPQPTRIGKAALEESYPHPLPEGCGGSTGRPSRPQSARAGKMCPQAQPVAPSQGTAARPRRPQSAHAGAIRSADPRVDRSALAACSGGGAARVNRPRSACSGNSQPCSDTSTSIATEAFLSALLAARTTQSDERRALTQRGGVGGGAASVHSGDSQSARPVAQQAASACATSTVGGYTEWHRQVVANEGAAPAEVKKDLLGLHERLLRKRLDAKPSFAGMQESADGESSTCFSSEYDPNDPNSCRKPHRSRATPREDDVESVRSLAAGEDPICPPLWHLQTGPERALFGRHKKEPKLGRFVHATGAWANRTGSGSVQNYRSWGPGGPLWAINDT